MYCTIYGSLMQATMVDYLCGSLQMWGTPMQFHFASLNYPINKKFKHHEWNNWFYQQAQGLNPKIPGKKSTSSLDMRDFQKRNSIAGSDDASKEENSKDRFCRSCSCQWLMKMYRKSQALWTRDDGIGLHMIWWLGQKMDPEFTRPNNHSIIIYHSHMNKHIHLYVWLLLFIR